MVRMTYRIAMKMYDYAAIVVLLCMVCANVCLIVCNCFKMYHIFLKYLYSDTNV